MKTRNLLIFKIALYSVIFSVFIVGCNKIANHDLVITNVNIIDVKTGEILENRTVVIDSSRIAAIYEKKPAFTKSTIVIDGSGKFLIPGLWDMHTHYNWNHLDSDPLLIANGITGVREMWGNMAIINEIRRKTKTGEIVAPDIYTSGSIIDGNPPYWSGSTGVSTPEEARNAVDKQIAEGVDFIKVYSNLSKECFFAIADEANKNNIPFAGHIPQAVSTIDAINTEMASSEHLFGLLEGCSSNEDSIRSFPWNDIMAHSVYLVNGFVESKFDSLCSVLAKSNMWICPTMVVNRAMGYLNDPDFTNDKRIVYLPPYITARWNLNYGPSFKENFEKYYLEYRKMYRFELGLIGKMKEKGVKFLAGTDYPNPYCFPGFSLHDELSLLVDGGMSEIDALRAATINGAIFMKKENDFGSIEEGKLASLVLLNKNPLANIENTKSIEAVILRGKLFDRPALDNMLDQAIINAAKIPYSFWLKNKISSSGIKQALDSLDILIASHNLKYSLQESDINQLGYAYLNSGNFETAQNIFKKNIELFPESFNVYDSYAESCMKRGQYEQALEFYKKSLEINTENEEAKIMLDSIRVKLKDL